MKSPRGYIALISVLISSALLFIAVLGADIQIYFSSHSLAGEIAYRSSRALTYSCAHVALHAISVDPSRFEHSLPLSFPLLASGTCTVVNATTTGMEAVLSVKGKWSQSINELDVLASRPSTTSPYVIRTLKEK